MKKFSRLRANLIKNLYFVAKSREKRTIFLIFKNFAVHHALMYAKKLQQNKNVHINVLKMYKGPIFWKSDPPFSRSRNATAVRHH